MHAYARRLVVALIVVLTTIVLQASPSSADPDCVYVWLDRQNAPRTYLLQPCQPTPWTNWFDGGDEYQQSNPIVLDITGVGFQVLVTLPA